MKASLVPVRPRRGPIRRLRRAVRRGLGWALLAIGGIFVLLPVVPGWPLAILGAVLLAVDVRGVSFVRRKPGVAPARGRFAEDFRRRFPR